MNEELGLLVELKLDRRMIYVAATVIVTSRSFLAVGRGKFQSSKSFIGCKKDFIRPLHPIFLMFQVILGKRSWLL